MRTSLAVVALLVTVPAGAMDSEIALLPLGDPARAYELAAGSADELRDARTAGAPVASVDVVAADFARADVVLLGEDHAHPGGHEMQSRLLRAMGATGRPLALGMEFFESRDDAALARYVARRSSLEEMLVETGWYEDGGFNFEMYRPVVETARDHVAPVLGLNVPREVVRKVSREGAESLSAEERALVGDLTLGSAAHRHLFARMLGEAAIAMPEMLDRSYRGQCAWDAAMTQSILRARAPGGPAEGRTLVVIVGAGHLAHGLGIPERLRIASPGLALRVLAPVSAERPESGHAVHPGFEAAEQAAFSRGYADVVHVLGDTDGAEPFPRLGVRLEESGGAPRVASVVPGSVAARSGLLPGDVLVELKSERLRSASEARLAIARLRWDERAEMKVRRGEADVTLPMLLVPGAGGDFDWLAAEPASGVLDELDHRSTRRFAKPEAPAGVHAVRVLQGDRVVRLDVRDGERLLGSWTLDDAGRVARVLLAEPAPDGAVVVEVERDGEGRVTTERRIDAAGKVIAPAAEAPGG